MRRLAGHGANYFRDGRFGACALAIGVAMLLVAPAAPADGSSTGALDEYQPPCSVYPDGAGCKVSSRGGTSHHGAGDQGQAGAGGTGGSGGSGDGGGGVQGGGASATPPVGNATNASAGSAPRTGVPRNRTWTSPAAALDPGYVGVGAGSGDPSNGGGSDVPFTEYPVTGLILLLGALLGGGILARLGLIGATRLRHARAPAGGGPPGADGAG
jgi:hypothetical protein